MRSPFCSPSRNLLSDMCQTSTTDVHCHYAQFSEKKQVSILILWTPEVGIPTLCKLPYFPTLPEVGIPSARYVNARARSRYTDGTVYQRQPPEVGIQTLFSNAYWPRHARVIEIQTRQQLKSNCFHETQRSFMNKFCIWTPIGQRTS